MFSSKLNNTKCYGIVIGMFISIKRPNERNLMCIACKPLVTALNVIFIRKYRMKLFDVTTNIWRTLFEVNKKKMSQLSTTSM